jgi:hypothetical protein
MVKGAPTHTVKMIKFKEHKNIYGETVEKFNLGEEQR